MSQAGGSRCAAGVIARDDSGMRSGKSEAHPEEIAASEREQFQREPYWRTALIDRPPRRECACSLDAVWRGYNNPWSEVQSQRDCLRLSRFSTHSLYTTSLTRTPRPLHSSTTMRILLTLACTLLSPLPWPSPRRRSTSTATCGRSCRRSASHCHGPDEKARKAKLRLDVRDEAVERGRDRARQAGRERADQARLLGRRRRGCRRPAKKPALTAEQIDAARSAGSPRGRSTPSTGRSQLTRPAVPEVGIRSSDPQPDRRVRPLPAGTGRG